jgi:hypothetical protein
VGLDNGSGLGSLARFSKREFCGLFLYKANMETVQCCRIRLVSSVTFSILEAYHFPQTARRLFEDHPPPCLPYNLPTIHILVTAYLVQLDGFGSWASRYWHGERFSSPCFVLRLSEKGGPIFTPPEGCVSGSPTRGSTVAVVASSCHGTLRM